MKKASVFVNTFLNVVMAVSLAVMAILVFGNVVLRYFFHSGITWSEEMARFLFIWMTFLGAIGALKDNNHLGVDIIVKRLSPALKKVVYLASNALLLYVLWLVLDGSWKMTVLNMNSPAPATGLPLSFVYGIGIVMSIGMSIILLYNIYQVLFDRNAIDRLTRMKESEEEMLASPHQQASQGGGSS